MGKEGAMTISTIKGPRQATLSLVIGLSMIGASSWVCNARAEGLSLTVPPAFQVAPGGEAPLAIQISPAASLPGKAILLIRGLPSTTSLSEGRLFESGVWGVPASGAVRLTVSTASGAKGRNDLSIALVTMDGTLLAEARSSLVIREGAPALPTTGSVETNDKTLNTAAPATRDIPSPQPAEVKRLSAEQQQQLQAMVRKGNEQMNVGNVSAARLLYRHAAENGLAAGALALAASYDADELRKLRVVGGVQPDQKQAQHWYEKARELGSDEARARLLRLGAR
jgi:TPR repeat protein